MDEEPRGRQHVPCLWVCQSGDLDAICAHDPLWEENAETVSGEV